MFTPLFDSKVEPRVRRVVQETLKSCALRTDLRVREVKRRNRVPKPLVGPQICFRESELAESLRMLQLAACPDEALTPIGHERGWFVVDIALKAPGVGPTGRHQTDVLAPETGMQPSVEPLLADGLLARRLL